MKPKAYDDYAPIFDAFSTPSLFPQMLDFVKKAASFVGENATIVDIGAGTGLFTESLIESCKPELTIFVEPSQPMLSRARERLGEGQIRYVNTAAKDAVNELDTLFDAAFLMRSLYCLFDSYDSYRPFAAKLFSLIKPNGVVCIYDPSAPYDIDRMYAYYFANKAKMGLDDDSFEEGWDVMKNVFESFNSSVKSGEFTLFDELKIRDIFCTVGFVLQEWSTGTYILRKM